MIISRPQGGYQLLTPLTECLCCGSNVLQRYLDLGMQPPPNAFNDGSIEPKKFPLETFVCCNCYHSQLGIAVSPNVLFSKYSYRTGVSVTLKAHYEELASQAVEYTNNKACSVLDIGCNDGTLLSAFKKLGLQTYGVDPCKVPDCSPDIDVFIEDYWRPRVIDSIINYITIIISANYRLARNHCF